MSSESDTRKTCATDRSNEQWMDIGGGAEPRPEERPRAVCLRDVVKTIPDLDRAARQ